MANKIAALNGITIAYVMGVANTTLDLVVSFGVNLTHYQEGLILALVNGLFIIVAHASYHQAKTTKPVIPAPAIDESAPPGTA